MNNELNIIPLDDRVRLKRIQTFFANGTWNPVSLMGSGMLAAMVLSSAGVSSTRLIIWLAVLFVFCAATLLFERYVRRLGLSLQNAKPLYRVRIFLGCVICALYGATAMFLPGLAAGTAHTFVFIITSSLVAVGYMAYATMFSYCLMVNVLAFPPFSIGSHTIGISASVGIAIFPQHGGAVDLLLRNADSAMYCAKHAGRNGYRFFDESMARAEGDSLPP